MNAPARAALQRAVAGRAESGTENDGFLSEEFGLLPVHAPARELPPTHRTWDEMAAQLPHLFSSVTGREALSAMPELDAGPDALPDAALLRAASLLGHFAHSYVRVRPDPPEGLPSCITAPWKTVCKRLGRDQVALTYDDLVPYNWRFLHEGDDRRTLDNLAVLTRTVANAEERIFYMVQVEVLARTAPAIGAMTRAQEAALARDGAALETELGLLIDTLQLATESFLKIDANPHSPTHVDPVVWAKTVAPFAVAINAGGHAISGAAAPIFQVFDVFTGRTSYASRVGREALRLRPGFSPNLRAFMRALGSVRIADVIAGGTPRLRGLWHSLLEAYTGDRGFLGVHRRKAYGFLEISFKVGRSVTTGGFTGLFEDQTWDVADRELEASRSERRAVTTVGHPVVHAAGTGRLTGDGLTHLRLDVAGAGLRFRPGDRLAIKPRNHPELVVRTLRALRATGEEYVALDARWRAAMHVEEMRIGDLIELGRIRPVGREAAKALLAFSESERLARIVNARAESAWELWDLLEHLAEAGFDPRALWRADPWDAHAIARLVPPESFRPYSIASAMERDVAALSVELLASRLRYSQHGSDVTPEATRAGTASTYLARLAEDSSREPVEVQLMPAPRFRLPEDPKRPIVMFAGGAGIAPFRAFIAERASVPEAGPAWLFLSTRNPRLRDDLQTSDARGVRLDAVVTGTADGKRITDLIAAHADELRTLVGDGNAVFYVCGPVGFAAAVVDALERHTSRETVRHLFAGRRLQQDVFTSAETAVRPDVLFDTSEIADRNDDANGYWTILDGSVYDMTEFLHRHPGGAGIVREVAGREGTAAYRQIEHHLDPEVEAMRPLYRIGSVRRLTFGRVGALAVGDDGLRYVSLADTFATWVRYLHLVVEVQNAVRHDFGVLDAVTVGDEPERFTFLKAQLLLEAHRRFVEIYVAALLTAELRRVWSTTTAFVDPRADVRELERRLDDEAQDTAGRVAANRIAGEISRLRTMGAADAATREAMLAEVAALREPLEGADLAFIAALKATIAEGVRAFERHERDTISEAGADLVAALRRIPEIVRGFYERCAPNRAARTGGR